MKFNITFKTERLVDVLGICGSAPASYVQEEQMSINLGELRRTVYIYHKSTYSKCYGDIEEVCHISGEEVSIFHD